MLIAGNPLETMLLAFNGSDKASYWAISSQASLLGKVEGSTTIPSGSRIQADPKRMAPTTGDDIVSSASKDAESLKKRKGRKMMYGTSGRAKRSRSVHNSCLHSTSRLHADAGFHKVSPCVAKATQQTVLIAGNPLEPKVPSWSQDGDNPKDWAISSQASLLVKVEGSTTIPSGSRTQEGSKRTAPPRGDDIVLAASKDAENQWNRLICKKTAIRDRRFGWHVHKEECPH